MSDIKLRMLYKHKKGKIFCCLGFAEAEGKKEVVIISAVDTGKVYVRDIGLFKGNDPDFVLVIPKEK